MVRNMTTRILEILGYKVFAISNPLTAISFCQKNDSPIDLLFTDIVMPKMNGIELSNKVKAINPKIKILFMSGYSPEINKKNYIVPKGTHFIEKPFSKNNLALKIENILNNC